MALVSCTAFIFWGMLADRFNPRLIMSISGIIIAAGYMLLVQVDSAWQLYLFYGVVAGIAIGAPDLISLSMVARWFTSNVGFMSGIAKVGAGVGIFLIPILVSNLLSTLGWRNTFLALGIIFLIVIVGSAQILKKHTFGSSEKNADTDKAKYARLPPESGLSFQEALRTRRLWVACLMFFCYMWSAQTVIIHIAPNALDMGLSPENAALTISVIGASSILGRLVMGNVSDRTTNRKSTSSSLILVCLSLIGFLFQGEIWLLYVLCAAFGFGHGGYVALISPKIAEIFGIRSHGTIFGLVMLFASLGGGIGPLLGGIMFDLTGSYHLVFVMELVLAAAALILNSNLKPIKHTTRTTSA